MNIGQTVKLNGNEVLIVGFETFLDRLNVRVLTSENLSFTVDYLWLEI